MLNWQVVSRQLVPRGGEADVTTVGSGMLPVGLRTVSYTHLTLPTN